MSKSRLARIMMVLGLTAGILAVGATPARSGSAEWTDPEGDATGFLVETSPLPSEPTLDVVKTSLSSDDKAMKVDIHVKKMASAPSASPGYFFRFNFTYAGEKFAVRVGKDPAQNVFQLRVVADQIGFDLPCKECAAKYDLEGNKVAITMPIASLTEGIKAADTNCLECRSGDPLPPFKKGAELSALDVTAQRYYVRVTPTADIAKAPAELTFTV